MAIFKRTLTSKSGKKTQYWYVQVRGSNKKLVTKSVGKVKEIPKSAVRQYERDFKNRIRRGYIGEQVIFDSLVPRFIVYVKDVKKNRSWVDIQRALNEFSKLFGERTLDSITAADIEDYKVKRLGQGRALATVKKELDFVRHYFNYAARTNFFFGTNPVRMSERIRVSNTRTRVLSAPEEERLIAAAAEPLRSFIIMSLYTGLRLNEIRGLEWEQVNLKKAYMVVSASLSKAKKDSVRPLSKKVKTLLLEAKIKHPHSKYVFPEANEVAKVTLSARFRSLCDKLKIKNLRFHDLRHTCGTRLAELGYDISSIAEVLGHSSLQMSMRYMHPKEIVRDALENLAEFPNRSTNRKKKA